jgi:hypothetical protein
VKRQLVNERVYNCYVTRPIKKHHNITTILSQSIIIFANAYFHTQLSHFHTQSSTMKTFSTAAVTAAAALLSIQVNASPAAPPASLSGRQATQVGAAIAQIIQQIAKGGQLAFPEEAFAWYVIDRRLTCHYTLTSARDYKKYRGMCMISMETKNGANCYAKVTCDDGTFSNTGKANFMTNTLQVSESTMLAEQAGTHASREAANTSAILELATLASLLLLKTCAVKVSLDQCCSSQTSVTGKRYRCRNLPMRTTLISVAMV